MFVICIKSSHEIGMGHLYRSMVLYKYLKSRGEDCLIVVNNHKPSLRILDNADICYEIANVDDIDNDWESRIIQNNNIKFWINDRLETTLKHANKVKRHDVSLISFDDYGEGAKLTDLHFAPLIFTDVKDIKGHNVLTGVNYLLLSDEIINFRRLRTSVSKILVTLGGSDTHGVTVSVLKLLKEIGLSATVCVGPSFEHYQELEMELNDNYKVIFNAPSIIETFYDYDLLISGGGVTPFEANASGLPCVINANEEFEVQIGKYLDKNNSSVFTDYHKNLSCKKLEYSLNRAKENIDSMSRIGIESIPLDAAENIYNEIKNVQ